MNVALPDGMLLAAATAVRSLHLFRRFLRRFLGGGFLGDFLRRLGDFLHGFLRYFLGHSRYSLKGFGTDHARDATTRIRFARANLHDT